MEVPKSIKVSLFAQPSSYSTSKKVVISTDVFDDSALNNNQKLDYICDNNHKYSISWGNFQQGRRCPYCSNKKINFSKIKNEFDKIEDNKEISNKTFQHDFKCTKFFPKIFKQWKNNNY